MLNSKIVDIIIRRLGNRRSKPALREAIVDEVVALINQMERDMHEVPFFLETIWSGVIFGGSVPLPANFLKELEEHELLLTDGEESIIVEKKNPAFVQAVVASNPANRPGFYYIFGDSLYFGPSADKSYSFSLPYGRKSTPFVDNGEEAVDWVKEAESAVMLSVQHNFAIDILQDAEMAARVKPRVVEAWSMFKDYCNSRKFNNLQVSAGADE